MATESTPLTSDDFSSISALPYESFSKYDTERSTVKAKYYICAVISTLVIMIVILGITFYPPKETVQSDESTNVLLRLKWPLMENSALDTVDEVAATSIIQKTVINATGDYLKSAVEEGYKSLKAKEDLEKNFPTIDEGTPSYRHQQVMKSGPESIRIARHGYIENIATEKLRAALNISKENNVIISSPNITIFTKPECNNRTPIDCQVQSRYRTVDGTCNNILEPRRGSSLTPYRRVIPADYSDGVWKPRKSTDCLDLPSANIIANEIHRPSFAEDKNFTVMLAVWGQFMDHDITATALSRGHNGNSISCCGSNNITHPECFPVVLPSAKNNCGQCMEFVRSAPASTCSFGPREQLNQASSFLDGSSVYGNSQDLQNDLRSWKDGKMKVFITENGAQLLPPNKDPSDGCNDKNEMEKGRYCFLSGDARANENMHLTTLHLIMVRQHNLIASKLILMNKHWSDEQIFQETRHIVTAQIQHITYNEFLPIILGDDLMKHLKLYSQKGEYWTGYNSLTDPSISNNFATAAFRFAHSLIPSITKFLKDDDSNPEYVEMRKMLFNPYKLYTCGGVDSVIRGAMNTSAGRADAYFTPEITRHLFEKTGSNSQKGQCGLDLVSLNIQRGRDHGLPAYPHWRKFCGFPMPQSFDDLNNVIEFTTLQRMKMIYKSVNDIDAYTGLVSEKPIRGGLLGPTITCLLADQFLRIKEGDRYWYETDEKPQAFDEDQLLEIRKTTFASIICDNSDEITTIQPYVMHNSLKIGNERISCASLIKMSLDPWKSKENNTTTANTDEKSQQTSTKHV
ncbi:lactoperoxidase-like isoform X2 [Daktulosphaira vitifoliae]|nr:lactoperoxidase-like isoform X2 [Daktulosphaira vitifoliae]XP_050539392.1 lactoperoxidase-like isoform X2 [Daktulosphaira vitifoliae]